MVKLDHSCIAGRMGNGVDTLKEFHVSYKTKHTITIKPEIGLLGAYPKGVKKKLIHKCLQQLCDSPNWEQHRCALMGEWLNKLWHSHTMDYFLLSHKKQKIFALAKWLSWLECSTKRLQALLLVRTHT